MKRTIFKKILGGQKKTCENCDEKHEHCCKSISTKFERKKELQNSLVQQVPKMQGKDVYAQNKLTKNSNIQSYSIYIKQ